MNSHLDLLNKYNVPAPRYTSYPTVPYWEAKSFDLESWKTSMIRTFWRNGREISLYIHLPYCESLCTYCGCHTYITKNHGVELPYVEALSQEWQLYLEHLPAKPILKEVHLGGGTPTFFDPQTLKSLLSKIIDTCEVPEDAQFSLEGHPRNTTEDHLTALHELGFDRLSLGIQDFDKQVQKTINRIQDFEQVQSVTTKARQIGYRSINYDLIYGLPYQTSDTIRDTFEKVTALNPDRIAFYSYAHVPTMKPAQKSFEAALPSTEVKLSCLQLGRELLRQAGYEEVGMDHFAKPEDELFRASQQGSLHRNFMGYTTGHHQMLIGLGASAIGDFWEAFVQNEKDISTYKQRVAAGEFPFSKGHLHSAEDLFLRQRILEIMCQGKTSWSPEELDQYGLSIHWELVDELEGDGLLQVSESGINITIAGKRFLRNISMALDARLWKARTAFQGFSKAV